jgi:cystathionine gamma-synthase
MSPVSHTTRTVRSALAEDTGHRSVIPPIYLSTNFVFDKPGECGRYDYTRSGNPTRDQLGDALSRLESGCGAVITSSGMSAVAVVTQLLSHDDVLLAPHDCYGGCHRLFLAESRRVGFKVVFVDQSSPEAVAAAHELRPRIIWLETPSNPLLRVTDIAAWSRVAKDVGATCVVDNTFLSPVNQRPLELGADLVVHSTTKLLNGHSDVVGGAVVSKDPELFEQIAWWANCLGLTGAPFDSFLTLRGVRTLQARSRVHEENTLAVVAALEGHSAVKALYHPSLPDHEGHEIAVRQQLGWGSLISFELHGGRTGVDAFLDGLEHHTLAESLGGVESLIAHPATMTHASMDEEARATAGITEGLLRLSVGIEDAADLVADVRAALVRVEEAACVAV